MNHNLGVLRRGRLTVVLPACVFLVWAWWTGRLHWRDPHLQLFAVTATLSASLWHRLAKQAGSVDLEAAPGTHQ